MVLFSRCCRIPHPSKKFSLDIFLWCHFVHSCCVNPIIFGTTDCIFTRGCRKASLCFMVYPHRKNSNADNEDYRNSRYSKYFEYFFDQSFQCHFFLPVCPLIIALFIIKFISKVLIIPITKSYDFLSQNVTVLFLLVHNDLKQN